MKEFLTSYLFLGKSLELWVIAIAYIIGGFAVGWFISLICSTVLKSIANKTKSHLDDIILAVTEKPLVFCVTIGGIRLGVNYLDFDSNVDVVTDKIFAVLVTIAVAWVIVKIIDSIIEEYLVPYVAKTEGNLDDQLLPIVRKGIKAIIWIFAGIVALKNTGYDVGALLAGLGIGGAAIAFAAKDTLSNFFGSIAVFIDRPFQINDRVKVSGIDGFVDEIGIRTSRIRTLDNRIVTIPNATFALSPIENISSEPNTKVSEVLDLTYDSGCEGVEKAMAILKEIAGTTSGLAGTPIVAFSSFGESALKITFIFYVAKGADYFGTLNAVNLAILRRFDEAKLEFAYPTRVLYNRK
jgi:MscS family membrane protein